MWKKKGREGAGNGDAAPYTGPDAKRKGGQADGVDQIRWQDSGFQEVSSPPPYRKSSRRQRAPRGSRLDASTGTLVYSHSAVAMAGDGDGETPAHARPPRRNRRG